jgi:hypothetical protein
VELADPIECGKKRIKTGQPDVFNFLSVTVSLHRMPPVLFGGYHTTDEGAKVATPEKALFDLIYLSPTRSRLFVSLPELELPKSFRWAEVNGWAKKIAGKSRRTFVEQKIKALRSAEPVR